uniref:Uncharacterized protein n=1 Tax=Malassezia furfur TaxID=55194 RepID=A0A2I6QC35_MALFU|nr:hypothetical protein [Malassezia furfur]AUN27943.1 hypothetical protein [Malassezia furfur]AUN27964.1 hypothetical protein [Malassezia furfur]AUN27967.1 hypothetical protein [Malassezia furfur]AUN28032.1 hypothetical protein [Malassezia furfur]
MDFHHPYFIPNIYFIFTNHTPPIYLVYLFTILIPFIITILSVTVRLIIHLLTYFIMKWSISFHSPKQSSIWITYFLTPQTRLNHYYTRLDYIWFDYIRLD